MGVTPFYLFGIVSRTRKETHTDSSSKKDKMADTELVTTALEFLARASSTSEVLTLNLTNLLILLVLKPLIFGFGLFSVGGTARSADDSPSFSETGLQGGMCFLMHMSGDESKLNCIKKSACNEPAVAAQYATASKMMYKVFKLLNVDIDNKYIDVLTAVEEAKNEAHVLCV